MDENKIVAAILAAEASRQKEMMAPSKGKDIAGDLLGYYGYFLSKLSEKKG